MTAAIKKLIESNKLLICPNCEGEGEFCRSICRWCEGQGIVKSLDRQTHKKNCVICGGKGCAGGCEWKGYREWESYELAD